MEAKREAHVDLLNGRLSPPRPFRETLLLFAAVACWEETFGLKDRNWPELAELFQDWVTLKAEQGAEVDAIRQRVEEAVAAGIADLSGLESPANFPYSEPETLAEIRDARPAGPRRLRCDLSTSAPCPKRASSTAFPSQPSSRIR